jgi:phosphate-selective porin OprO/OprP
MGVEGLWVRGPLKLQAEYMNIDVKRFGSFEDFSGDGYYVSGLWNVTGETWGYKAGAPTTGLPDDPAKGLWQLGLRYDTIDLTDGAVVGGEMDSITAGVNWYWRSNFKFMLNYVKVEQEKGVLEDNPDVIEARLQFYW